MASSFIIYWNEILLGRFQTKILSSDDRNRCRYSNHVSRVLLVRIIKWYESCEQFSIQKSRFLIEIFQKPWPEKQLEIADRVTNSSIWNHNRENGPISGGVLGCFRALIGAHGVMGVCLALAGVGWGRLMQIRGFVYEFSACITWLKLSETITEKNGHFLGVC